MTHQQNSSGRIGISWFWTTKFHYRIIKFCGDGHFGLLFLVQLHISESPPLGGIHDVNI